MRSFLAILLLTGSALAQFTTVTGTVIDPHNVPYALGTITPLLVVPSGAGSPSLNGQPYSPPTQAVGLDKNGSFSFNIADTSILLPAGTKWNFTVCSAVGTVQPAIGTGPQCFSLAAPITITGSSQNISTQLNAVALALTIPINGGGNIAPGTNAGQFPVWNPGTVAWVPQNKALYDVRDPGLGFACDGSTDDTAAMDSLLARIGTNHATIQFPTPSAPCLLSTLQVPANVTLDFSAGGSIKLVQTSTPPGGAHFVQGVGHLNANPLTNSCSVTLTGTTAGNTIVFLVQHFFTGAIDLPPSDGHDYFQPILQQGFNFSNVVVSWAAADIAGGTVTVTAPLAASVQNACFAYEFSGLGIGVALDAGVANVESSLGSLTMQSPGTFAPGPLTTTTGALLIGYGGNPIVSDTCTPGAGQTQPAGTVGTLTGVAQPGTGLGELFCASYKLSSPGGNQTLTAGITQDPLTCCSISNRYWTYSAISIIPGSANINVLGGIVDPDLHQIFYNAEAGQGTVDFTGNLKVQVMYPEWWGASPAASAAVNSPALQAAVVGAYGIRRINGSGLNQYNKELRFSGVYQVNADINANNMDGFKWTCIERFACGLQQTATNTSILSTTQGGVYGNIDDFNFSSTVSQDLNHPLVDLNYTAPPGADLVTQFLHFNRNIFNGNGVAAIGLRIAAAGGTAQGSNITHDNNEFENFTEAAYMVGNGAACIPSALATNAISITIGGASDFQGNHAYAFENFGGGQIKFDNDSFEDGFGANTNMGVQTGYDICGQVGAAGEYVIVEDSRTESRYFLSGGPYVVRNSFMLDQWFHLAPGSTPGAGVGIEGSFAGGDGVGYNVTTGGTWTGAGTEQSPIFATSSTATSLTNTNQSIAGANTIGTFVKLETVTQGTTGSTGTLLNVPVSIGTVTGSVTSGTIGVNDTITQASTGAACKVVAPAPTGSGNLLLEFCSATADNSHVWTDGTTGGTYTPSTAPVFAPAIPVMVITAATGSPDSSHNWTGGTSGAVLVPSGAPTNTANYTSNQWVNYQITITNGTGQNQYCVITSNSAQTVNCSGGWTTRYPASVTTTNSLDDTSTYVIEPNWGTQFTNGSVVWAADNKVVGTLKYADGFFVSGLKVSVDLFGVIHGLQVTRADWQSFGTPFPVDNIWNYDGMDGIWAGTPAGSGSGQLTPGLARNWGFNRNGITGIKSASQHFMGTVPLCWASGLIGGGITTSDVCVNVDPNAGAGTKKGRWYIENNSSGTPFFWYFNSDGTATFPGVINGTDFNGTIGATSPNAGTFTSVSATSVSSATYATATNCAQSGTAANPSVVSCVAAAAGAFACNVAASAGTCVVNTTAVGANSRIIVQETTTENTSLGVTCNTSPTVLPSIPVASKSPGVSFTINMPTITTNPACFDYLIVNQ
jgi:hypothetical protein